MLSGTDLELGHLGKFHLMAKYRKFYEPPIEFSKLLHTKIKSNGKIECTKQTWNVKEKGPIQYFYKHKTIYRESKAEWFAIWHKAKEEENMKKWHMHWPEPRESRFSFVP